MIFYYIYSLWSLVASIKKAKWTIFQNIKGNLGCFSQFQYILLRICTLEHGLTIDMSVDVINNSGSSIKDNTFFSKI